MTTTIPIMLSFALPILVFMAGIAVGMSLRIPPQQPIKIADDIVHWTDDENSAFTFCGLPAALEMQVEEDDDTPVNCPSCLALSKELDELELITNERTEMTS